MFVSLLIGAILMAGFLLVVDYARKKNLHLSWWQWLLTVLAFLYAAFVLEVIYAFLQEGTSQGAFVIGMILGIVAIIWGVLLGRFVFARQTS